MCKNDKPKSNTESAKSIAPVINIHISSLIPTIQITVLASDGHSDSDKGLEKYSPLVDQIQEMIADLNLRYNQDVVQNILEGLRKEYPLVFDKKIQAHYYI